MYISAYQQILPTLFEHKHMSKIKKQSYQLGTMELDRDAPCYPSRSDEKIMRADVKAAILAIDALRKGLNLEDVSEIPLYVANGAFVENTERHLERISRVYRSFDIDTTEEERMKKIYKASPPLVALETLTNSVMSFIAQYIGFKSENATFGNTSLGSFYALRAAQSTLRSISRTIVCSSNVAGDYSFLSNSTVKNYKPDWFESAAVGCLCLDAEASSSTLGRITLLRSSASLPNLFDQEVNRSWKELLPDTPSDALIFSGAYCKSEEEEDRKYLENYPNKLISLFREYGNTGPSNNLIGIIKATGLIKDGLSAVDIIDRDLFGRETLIRVESC